MYIGVGKTKGVEASVHGVEINTAKQLCNYLREHHSEVTRTPNELIHQVDKRKFHYLPHGSFLTEYPYETKALSGGIKPHYSFRARRKCAFVNFYKFKL